MAIVDRQTLKNWFLRGLKPLAVQFAAWIDSFWHKTDMIPANMIDGLQKMLDDFVISVTKIVTDAAKGLQLEKRIGITMEGDSTVIALDEPLMIYRAGGKNISKLEIKANTSTVTEWVNVPLNSDIDIILDYAKTYDAVVRITRITTNNESSIYLYAKVIPAP